MKKKYGLFNQILLITAILVLNSMLSMSATYYVSNSGNDSNSGLTTGLAWQTITKVNATTFSAGDQILFERGGTFYGGITINQSGTSGNPIIFGAYGTGVNPVISGFTNVTAWKSMGGNIWESTSAVSTLSTCNVVVINGKNVGMGRFPNSTDVVGENKGYLIRVEDLVSKITIENAALSGINWTGAEVVTRTHHTRIDRRVISSHSGSIITFPIISNIGNRAGFFIQNDIRTLDSQNEWYYNPTTKKISVYSTTEPMEVKASSVTTLLVLSGSYIAIENITFSGSNGIAVTTSSGLSNITFQNNGLLFTGNVGIDLTSTTTAIITGNVFKDTNDNAIRTASCTGLTITNNDIKNTGLIKGIDPDGGCYAGILLISGSNILVQYNSLDSLCNNGINFSSTQTQIRNNFVNHCSINMSDGAAISGHSYSGANTIIDGNIVMNGYGAPEGTWDGEFGPRYSAGIYTDDYSVDCTISNNTAYNFPWMGIYLKTSDYITVSGNTTFNNKIGLYIQTYEKTNTHSIITNNKFVAKASSQLVVQFRTNVSDVFTAIQSADNNIYARPIKSATPVTVSLTPGGADYSVAGWQTYSGLDLNSKSSPISITSESDLQFEYNASKTVKTVSLSRPMIDVAGTKYANSVTLEPYTSVVLMKDPNPAPVDATAPVISSFSIPTSVISLTVSVSTLTATDNTAVTGYLLTESSTKPSVSAAGWSSTKPTSFALSSFGTKSIYAWAKDAAGNISSGFKADVTASLPAVTSTEFKAICEGTDYNGWTITGRYERTLDSKAGGDSIVTTFLTVNPTYSVNEEVTINEGESYNGWTTSGQYSRTMSSVSGCDSIVTTILNVDANAGKQGEIVIPTYFIPVWQGQTGQSLMTFVVKSALLEDQSLDVNDEIAVFSGSLCVGAGKLAAPVNPLDQNTYLSFTASKNTGTNNGYSLNDTIVFKIWDNSNAVEKSVQLVNYQSGNSPIITTGRFTALATAVVEIESYTAYTQTIALTKGNNLISSNLIAGNPDLGQVMKSLCDQGAIYKMQDEAGRSLEYWGKYGGWVNKIGNLTSTEGYNLTVNFNCNLVITGKKVGLPLDIPLKKGWNFISFPQTSAINALTVVQSLIDQNKLKKVMDERGNSIEYLRGNGWINNIGNFIPGEGYKVYVDGNTNLTIQQSYPKAAVVLAQTQNTEYFTTVVEGNGTGHMNINIVGLNQSGLSAGDELAVFDGELCVGAIKINENNISTGIASLISSISTNDQNPNGYQEGHPILLYSWNKNTNEKLQINSEIVDGELFFVQNASVLLKIGTMTTASQSLNLITIKTDVFPNPSRGNFIVRMSEMPEAGSKIEVMDVSGRIITTRLITDSSESFNLDGHPSGLYLVKTVLGSNSVIHKIIVNK
jgi:parallel beta-helix repeat protein